MRGQSSIEYMTMLLAFFTIFLPIVLLFLTQTSIRSEPLKQDQITTAVALLKQKVEETHAACPAQNSVFLSFPSIKSTVSFEKEGGKPYLKVENERGGFITPVDVAGEVDVRGSIEVSGSRVVFINCGRDSEGKELLEIVEEVSP